MPGGCIHVQTRGLQACRPAWHPMNLAFFWVDPDRWSVVLGSHRDKGEIQEES